MAKDPHPLTHPTWTLGQLAALTQGVPFGPLDVHVARPVPLHVADPEGFAFVRDRSRLNDENALEKGFLIVPTGTGPLSTPTLEVENPELIFFQILQRLVRPLPVDIGIDARAFVGETAEIDASASVGAFAYVADDVHLGANVRVHPFAYIGPGCRLEEGCEVLPHAILVQDVTLCASAKVWPGAVIGGDGFGYVPIGGRQVKKPQVGRVEVGPDAEIGANTTIDRATVGVTRIGEGVKLDNLVQVGHNVEVGAHTVMAAQVGIGGSSRIGEWGVLGGQVGVADHVTLPARTFLGGQAGAVLNGIDAPGAYWGTPAMPYRSALRAFAALRDLPDLVKRVKDLERALAEKETV